MHIINSKLSAKESSLRSLKSPRKCIWQLTYLRAAIIFKCFLKQPTVTGSYYDDFLSQCVGVLWAFWALVHGIIILRVSRMQMAKGRRFLSLPHQALFVPPFWNHYSIFHQGTRWATILASIKMSPFPDSNDKYQMSKVWKRSKWIASNGLKFQKI